MATTDTEVFPAATQAVVSDDDFYAQFDRSGCVARFAGFVIISVIGVLGLGSAIWRLFLLS